MEELVALVVEKTDVSEEQAGVVVEVVLDFIKGKLPASIAGQLDAVLEGKSDLGSAADALGSLFG
ncbi:MAG TPA: DUF2267 domain-containing protein [Anaerolineales bacterium]|nr:DUF2267 domain-containing protein [Anaerolineales bacterium]